MTMSELVSRLLATIEQRETEALSISAGRFVEGMAGRRVDLELSRYVDTIADPDSVLRLCRAHRNIIEQYRRFSRDKAEAVDAIVEVGPGSPWDERLAMLAHSLNALEGALLALAEGYGITEEG